MKRIPDKINIMGRYIKVSLKKDLGAYGFSYLDKNKIELCSDLNRDQLRATLLHEIMHFIIEDSNLERFWMSSDGDVLDERTETIVSEISSALYQVLETNKL